MELDIRTKSKPKNHHTTICWSVTGSSRKENMETLKFTIFGQPITKKNSQIIFYNPRLRRVQILPSKQFTAYEKECRAFMPACEPIVGPVNVKATYYMGRRNKVDLCNLHEALHDILTHYGVIADDNSQIIFSTDGSRVIYDKENPRTEVEITSAGAEAQKEVERWQTNQKKSSKQGR